MLNFLEILERSEQGRALSASDWDYEVAMTTRELVKKHGLDWDKTRVINDDPARASALFDAAFELAERQGVYNYSTGRAVRFTPDELLQGLRAAPRSITLGEGKDARTLDARTVCDRRPPKAWGGTPGTPVPEQLFVPMTLSYAQERLIDMVTCGTLTHVDGRVVETGSPLEITATRRELAYLREALRQAGRPGTGLLAAQSSVSEIGDLSVASPAFMRPCDAHLVPMLNELKIENRNLARVINSLDYGMLNASLACVIVGGMGGAAPGSAVVQAASFILANLCCAADYHLLHPIDIRHVATSTRAVLWVSSIVAQAFAQRSPCVIVGDIYPKSGAGTRELLYETAANAIVHTVSGSHLEGCGAADGKVHHASGLEARFMAEVGRAATEQALDLERANELAVALVKRYEFLFQKGAPENQGLPFNEVYDLVTVHPTQAWNGLYEEIKCEVRTMGLAAL